MSKAFPETQGDSVWENQWLLLPTNHLLLGSATGKIIHIPQIMCNSQKTNKINSKEFDQWMPTIHVFPRLCLMVIQCILHPAIEHSQGLHWWLRSYLHLQLIYGQTADITHSLQLLQVAHIFKKNDSIKTIVHCRLLASLSSKEVQNVSQCCQRRTVSRPLVIQELLKLAMAVAKN